MILISKFKLIVICNLVFFLYSLHYVAPVPNLFLSMLINLMMFFLPGICWVSFFNKKTEEIVPYIFLVICISLAIMLSGCLFFYITKMTFSSVTMLIFLVLISNVGLFFSKPLLEVPRVPLNKIRLVGLFLLSIILYIVLYGSALRIVPPLEDHDSETQGTAYGLMHKLKPYMVTNRRAVYFFAHPLLLHFYIGNSFLLLDELDEVSYYYDSALEGEKDVDKTNESEQLDKIWKGDFQKFVANPHLLATRMPNLFFSVLIFYFLFLFLYSSTNSYLLSLSGPILYFTFPEVFVRSCYGGYMAIENFFLLMITYLYFFKDRLEPNGKYNNALFLLSGLFGGFASQKMLIVVIAMVILDFTCHDGTFFEKVRASLKNRIVQGVIFGTLFFWGYGFLVDSKVFIEDYLKQHMAYRFRLNDVRFTFSNKIWYPSISDLWKEFCGNLGFPFLFVALPLTIYTLFRIKRKESFFGLWFMAGAVLFSITDWRQTKHLMLIILPLIIAMILHVSKSRQWVKIAFTVMLLFLVYNNITVILKIAEDFSTISPTPIW